MRISYPSTLTTLVVTGILTVGTLLATTIGSVGSPVTNGYFTDVSIAGTFELDASAVVTGDYIPSADSTYDIGSNTIRIAEGYFDNATIADIAIETSLAFPTTTISDIIDDDTMGTASATTLATSESVKAYADSVGLLGATVALDNLASVAINTGLISDTADTDSIGSATKEWLNYYMGDAGKFYIGLGQDISLHRSAANELTLTASGGTLLTGPLGITGTRVSKGWFTDLEVTNDITIGGSALATIYSPIAGSSSIVTVGTLSAGNATAVVDTATTSAQGKTEASIASEVNTGTDAVRFVSPDSLAGSNYGIAKVELQPYAPDGAWEVTDQIATWRVPAEFNGWNLVGVAAYVISAGTTGLQTMEVYNLTQTAQMLSTNITIDSTETDSSTAATPAVIDTAEDDVATADVIQINSTVIQTTPAEGGGVQLFFQLP